MENKKKNRKQHMHKDDMRVDRVVGEQGERREQGRVTGRRM